MKPITEFLKRHSLSVGIMLMFQLAWPVDLSNAIVTAGTARMWGSELMQIQV
jgi:hypothetical protein